MPGGRDVGDTGDGPHRDAWLRDHMEEVLQQIEKEAERRQGRTRRRTTISEMRILEPGLWAAMPAEVWRMEMRLAERQGAEFRLLSPDEPAARTAYTEAHADIARARMSALAQLKPVADMFSDDDTDEPDEDEAVAVGDDNAPDEEENSDD